MKANPTVIVAAAGSGKTTELVTKYLSLLHRGLAPSEIIAITFTRAAGAELIDRVQTALRAAEGDSDALASLGKAWQAKMQPVTPTDPAVIARARRQLAQAPIGTTDSFVQRLLNEFGLHAALGIGAERVALDLPVQVGDAPAVFASVARQVVDGKDGILLPSVQRLLAERTLAGVVDQVSLLAGNEPQHRVLSACELFEAARLVAAQALRATYGTGANKPGAGPGKAELEAWLADGADDPAPDAAVAYCGNRMKENPADAQALAASLAALPALDFGCVVLPVKALVGACADWPGEAARKRADTYRSDLVAVASLVRDAALRECVASGALSYELLSEVAIELCQQPPPHLRSRFRALLVDEAQDASPQQMRLYAALTDLPGDGAQLETVYVGDPRQSIYLFRGAEPAIFDRLLADAQAKGGVESLNVNFRSTPELVRGVGELFAFAAEQGLPGVLSIADVTAAKGSYELPATDLLPACPIHIAAPRPDLSKDGKDGSWNCATATDKTLRRFLKRLQLYWSAPETANETAAVLCPNWHNVATAVSWLNAVEGGFPAFQVGGKGFGACQPARDIRTLVRALWDPTQKIAWAAVWKLPCIGLSDGALALLSRQVGVVNGFPGLSGAAYGQALDGAVHRPEDAAAFALAAPALQTALASIGRMPTADVVEQLAASLRWRHVLRAGPDGEMALAQFDVALDWIRQAEADGVDPAAVVELLCAEDDGDDAPRVHIDRGARTIAVTTVFQAKGLEYDHVCVIDIGNSPKGSSAGDAASWHGEPVSMIGVELDPAGALRETGDPVKKLSAAVDDERRQAERLRFAYVAMTRAKKSVTFGLTRGKDRGLHGDLGEAWGDEFKVWEQVFVDDPKEEAVQANKLAHAAAVADLQVEPLRPAGWIALAPSSAEKGLGKAEVDALVARLVVEAHVVYGGAPIEVPGVSDKVVPPNVRGEVLHGWMAAGCLDDAPSVDKARAYLRARWHTQEGDLEQQFAGWLHTLAVELPLRQPELYAGLRAPGVQLVFEVPMLGVGLVAAGEAVYNGRIDLLVRRADGALWVIDFKGANYAGDAERRRPLGEWANLKKYGAQMVAYREALGKMGERVEKVGLLFSGAWDWVWW